MLTRSDRTIEDAACLVDAASELGVRHIGFKDVGVPFPRCGSSRNDPAEGRRIAIWRL